MKLLEHLCRVFGHKDMSDDNFPRLQQLQREEAMLRQLLAGKLSDGSRFQLRQILDVVRAEIEDECGRIKASVKRLDAGSTGSLQIHLAIFSAVSPALGS
jgi:hypothetical protein